MSVVDVLVVLVVLEVPEELLELRGLSGGPGSVTLLCWVVSVGNICGGCAGGGSAQCAASVAAWDARRSPRNACNNVYCAVAVM